MNENWTPKNPPPELSDTDAELLSAYIDNMLDSQERANLEARLANDAFLRSELAAMRQMLGWLKTMPTLKAPRNFTITEADVKPAAPKVIALPRRNNSWQIASAAAVFVLIIGGVLLFNQLGLAPKSEAPANDVALMSTEVLAEESRDFFAETAASPLLATVGPPPQEIVNASGAPVEAESSAERSGEFGSDTETSASGDNAQEQAPQGSSSSGGGSGTTSNPEDGGDETTTAFGGGAADGQLADIQVMTTSTSMAMPVTMPTMTAQATASPQPTLSAQMETRLFEPTAEADTAANYAIETASPMPEAMIIQPTMVIGTGQVVMVSPTVELVEEESMMTMSIVAESTEAAAETGATVLDSTDDHDANADGASLANQPVDISSRINEILRRILLSILED